MTMIKFSNGSTPQKVSLFPMFNELFSDIFENSVSSDFRRWNSPAVNIVDHEDKFELQIAAPGLSKEDLKIKVDGDRLVISAEKTSENTEGKGKFTRREFQFNSFSRSFNLPDEVNLDAIEAAYENGMTIITLPKHAEVKPKMREIKLS